MYDLFDEIGLEEFYEADEELDYDGLFGEPSEAERVIRDAQTRLAELFSEEVKSTIQRAREADAELDRIEGAISEAKRRLEELKATEAKAEKEFEESEWHKMPERYINRFVTRATGGYAPGDTVWTIEERRETEECSTCSGEKEISVNIKGVDRSIKCPTCGGCGLESHYVSEVKERQVASVHLKLCFEKSRVGIWSSDSVYLVGNEWSTRPERIFRSKEDAEKRLEETKNA